MARPSYTSYATDRIHASRQRDNVTVGHLWSQLDVRMFWLTSAGSVGDGAMIRVAHEREAGHIEGVAYLLVSGVENPSKVVSIGCHT